MNEQGTEETIKLDQFLKLAGVVETGGQAKHLILEGFVKVNGEVENRRGRKLHHGDRVEVEGEEMVVLVEPD
jgi:ribosome-associated protein